MTEGKKGPRGERQDPRLVERMQMIRDQLRSRGLEDPRVLHAMSVVPREEFVPPQYRADAYRDAPLPIGFGQTISQPFTVAFMVDAVRLTAKDRVLEIGTGSGYQAAVMSRVAREVHTLERIPELAESAREVLARLGYDNVHVHLANGTLGLPELAPFDAIAVTASSPELPEPYADQLAEGGRILIPIGADRYSQQMYRFTLENGELTRENLGGFAFVPLIGRHGWKEE